MGDMDNNEHDSRPEWWKSKESAAPSQNLIVGSALAKSQTAAFVAYCIIFFSVVFGAWHTSVLVYHLAKDGNAGR